MLHVAHAVTLLAVVNPALHPLEPHTSLRQLQLERLLEITAFKQIPEPVVLSTLCNSTDRIDIWN